MKKWYFLSSFFFAIFAYSFSNAQSIAKFHPGLYVILRADSFIQFTSAPGGNLSIPTKTFLADSSQNYVDGYVLQMYWNTLLITTSGSTVTSIKIKNPTSGQGKSYIELDTLFKIIERHHKYAAIGVSGSYVAPMAKKYRNLIVENDSHAGGPCLDPGDYNPSGNVRLDTFPVPWDTGYEHDYKKIITQLQQYLVSHNDTISYINFGAITTTADEVRIPNDIFCIESLNIHENDFIKWHNVGYYDTKRTDSMPYMQEAFQYFVDSVYGASFPNTTLWVGAMRYEAAIPNIPDHTPPQDGTDCSNPQMANFFSCANGPYLDHSRTNGYKFSDLMYDNLLTTLKDPKAPPIMIADCYLDEGYDQPVTQDYVHIYNNYKGMNNTPLCGTIKGNELAQCIFQPGSEDIFQDSMASPSFASRIGAALWSGANVGVQVIQIWPINAYMTTHGATKAIRDTVKNGLTRASYALKYLSPYIDGTPRKFPMICKIGAQADTFSIAGAPTSLLFAGISWTLNDKTAHTKTIYMGQKVIVPVMSGHLYTVTLAYNNSCGAIVEDSSLCTPGSAPLSGASKFTDYWCSYDTLHPMKLGGDAIPGATYNWTPQTYLNNVHTAQPQILFSTPKGIYTFNEQILLGTCQGSDTEVVTVETQCCHSNNAVNINNGNDSLLLIALGQTYSPYHNTIISPQAQVYINGPFNIQHPLTLSHTGNKIKFGPKSTILVQNSSDTLILDSLRMNGCATYSLMWGGIKNTGGTSGLIADSVMFLNADTAILSTNNSYLSLVACHFNNNWESLVLEHYTNGDKFMKISACSFDVPRSTGLWYPHAGVLRSLYGIYLSNVFSFNLGADKATGVPFSFRRMQNGIYSDTSKFNIYHVTMTHCSQGIYINGGIPKGTDFNPPNMAVQIGGTTTGSGVQMTWCQNGILFRMTDGYVYRSSLNISSDSMAYGVLFKNGANNYCQVENTTIKGQLRYGVDFLGNTNGSSLTVANDTISFTAKSPAADTGVFYGVNVGGTSSISDLAKDTIQNSYINISNTGSSAIPYNRYGIYVTNKGGGYVISNNSILFQSNPNYTQYGIRLENASSGVFTGNTVAGTAITPGSAAISFVSSPRPVISCNNVSFTKSGIEFIGDNYDYSNAFRLAGNQFSNNFDAIKLGDSLLGPGYMNSMMTYTCGSSTVLPANQFVNISSNGLHSFGTTKKGMIYYYYNTQTGGGTVKPSVHNEVPTQGFVDSSKSTIPLYDCGMSCVLKADLSIPVGSDPSQMVDENLVNASAIRAINGELNFSTHNDYMQFALKSEIYNDLQQMDQVNLANELKFFADTTSQNNIGKFYQYGQIMQKRDDYGLTDGYSEQLREQALSMNASIHASSIYEQNQVQVNDIYLRTFGAGITRLSPAQINELKMIAYQCPFDGGNAVFEARGLLATNGFNPSYNDDKTCQQVADAKTPIDNVVQSAFSLSPNPAMDKVTLNYYLKDDQVMNYFIMNALGKMIESGRIATSVNSQTFDVSNFGSGVYFVKITSTDGKENHNLRMTVTH